MSRGAIVAGFAALEAALEGARGREEARERPDGWCAREIAEHVALTDLYLLRLARTCADKCRSRAARGAATPRQATVEATELARCASALFRWEAPDHMRPTGAATLAASLATIAAQRDEALLLWDELCAGEAPAGRLHDVAMGVLGPGARIALPELLVFLALHAGRHARQVERAARADRDHPSGGRQL